MKRHALRATCELVLITALAIAPAPALARPVRAAPALDLAVDALAAGSGASFTPIDSSPAPNAKTIPLVPAGTSAFAADAFPGEPVQWIHAWTRPILGSLDAAGSANRYYSIYLEAGEEIWLDLYGPDSGQDFDLYLYNPSSAVAYQSTGNTAEESITGIANVEGTWSVRIEALSGAGEYELYANFASPDDNAPAVPIPSSPVTTTLDSYSDWDDVYRVWLNAGDTFTASLTRGSTYTGNFYPSLYLYSPETTDIWSSSPIEGREGLTFPKVITYRVATSGYYYIDAYEVAGLLDDDADDTHDNGKVRIDWKVTAPVYRFYNFTNNTHFFTDSIGERDMVSATWPHIFRYEGVAYSINRANNVQQLYRFYNRVSKSHFYTASDTEAATVMARWSNVYNYDGRTYAVNPGPVAGSAPVYRFYNLRNGSHFYTASVSERDTVAATWPDVYRLEGTAFWIGQ